MIKGLAVSTALFLLSAIANAQAGHTIRGKVRDINGAGVSRVLVLLESGNGAMIGQVTTSTEGDFYFPGLTENSYTVKVSQPDHQPAFQQVSFSKIASPTDPGETQFVEITLRPLNKKIVSPVGPVFAQDVPTPARKKYDEASAHL